jgi:hypothetical protein
LGEFSPVRKSFTQVSFSKNAELAHIFEQLFQWGELCVKLEKMDGAKFWAIRDRCYDFKNIFAEKSS